MKKQIPGCPTHFSLSRSYGRSLQRVRLLLTSLVLALSCALMVHAQTTTFTYQGRLTDGSTAASGTYDLKFSLFSAASSGSLINATIERTNVTVLNGVFTVQLDFGSSPFTAGADRFLEIAVKRPAETAYTTLSPRQPITAAPYAIRTLSAATAETATTAETAETAETATNAQQLGGVAANQYVLTGDARLIDARPPAAGSVNYVQNTTSPQASANFNIAGDGTAGGTLSGNTVNAATQYNLGGNRVLSIAGSQNLFAGISAGAANTTGRSNSFVGAGAGFSNTTGNFNSFLGVFTGPSNTTGSFNTLLGFSANVSAGDLTFATAIGAGANVAASNTLTLGRSADTVQVPGALNVTGALNADGTNLANLNAGNIASGTLANARLGVVPTANGGTGLGAPGAAGNLLRSNGSIWTTAALAASDIPAASTNYVQNRSTQQATTNFNISGDGTAGGTLSGDTVNAATQYNLGGSRVLSVPGLRNTFAGVDAGAKAGGISNSFFGFAAGQENTGGDHNSFFGTGAGRDNRTGLANSFFGYIAGIANETGNNNSFFGFSAGEENTTGDNNSFFGIGAGRANTTGSHNTIIGEDANVGSGTLTFATAIGANAIVSTSNTIVLGRSSGADKVRLFGLGAAGSLQLCRNNNNEISTCSSSLRYKTNFAPFTAGLNVITRLRPLSFDWKDGGMKDIGFGAEEVAAINPLFVTYNAAGEVEGIKYDRLSVVFVNAFHEQQTRIESQQSQLYQQSQQLAQQQALIDGLRQLVCQTNARAAVCQGAGIK